ncbi:MAG: S1 RNA-binding domain-containing protein [Actinomycetota bacterium]
MADKKELSHVVVDGSNIATEGRSMPSLAQLEEAVTSFMDEHPDTQITVVVDATFAHRIDKSEVKRYEGGIANNELVAPPAGAVGRGDAFVLGIADKAGSAVISNDSFQEFHGEYPWLFDDGRLIGGKPVPHVGWVWVERNPVRGPVSRKATRDSKSSRSGSRSRSSGASSRRGRGASKEASKPMPVPTAPPPGVAATEEASAPAPQAARSGGRGRQGTPKRGEPVNELMPFLDFVERQPVGSTVTGEVDAYSSHGAYLAIGGVRGYLPLRLMSDPPPRSAKKIVAIGETVEVVVVSFAAARRSIDCALPAMAEEALAAAAETAESDESVDADAKNGDQSTGRRATKQAAAKKAAAKKSAAKETAATKTTVTKASGKKTAAAKTTATKASGKKTAARKSAAKKSATKTAVEKRVATRSVAKKTPTKKTATKKSAAKRTATEKSAAKRTATEKTAAKKTATKKTATKKAVTKQTATKKKSASRSAVTKKRSAKKSAAAAKRQDT